MSLRSLYQADLAAGQDVSAHDGRPAEPGAFPDPPGPVIQVVRVQCDQCGTEAYHQPNHVPPDRMAPGVLHLCDGWAWGVWRRVP